MAAVRERLLLVVGSDITYDTTSWWASEGLPGVLKKHSSVYCEALFSTLGHLVGVSDYCFTLACASFRR